MADTTFNSGTVVAASWLNDINNHVYNGKSLDNISVINVKDPTYGAVGNGVTDDTAAIQAAIDAASAAGGGIVFLPPGTYLLTDTITFYYPRVFLRGAGMWNTKLTRSGDFGDTIIFGGGQAGSGVVLSDTGISDLTIVSTGLMTSGAHIRYSGVSRHQLKGIYLNNGFIGIRAEALTAAYLSDIYIVFTNIFGGTATGRRYLQFGSAYSYSHSSCGDVFITNFNVRGNTSNQLTEFGVNIESADGIWFENGHVGNATEANIHISGPTVDMINLVFFSNVMTDEGTGYGLLLESYAALGFRSIKFVNCMFKSGGIPAWATSGIVVSAGCEVSGLSFDNCTVTEFGRTGVTLGSTSSNLITFSNCTIRGNGRNTADTYPGYNILNGVSSVNISGGSSGNGYGTGIAASQSYGIQFGIGHSNIVVTGVDLTGNTLGSVLGGSNSVEIIEACLTQDAATAASGSTVTLPIIGDLVTITGTTTINNIQVSRTGRKVTLKFADVLTVNDGGNLKLAGSFSTSADDTLTLIYDGTHWIETSRSVN